VRSAEGTLLVPRGRSLDPGGIGKGLAADLTVEDLQRHGARGALVNLGGDIRVWGEPPGPDGWVISVDHPLDPDAELVRVVLADGSVASTSRLRRQWGPSGAAVHHLLDPATGCPAYNGVAGVTVFAGTGWRAEAFTKAAFLAGPDGAVGVLEAAGLDGIVVTDDGESRMTPNMVAISV
jgi:thiamine biosynthesis lipoprotein